jgi:hypothetical protein
MMRALLFILALMATAGSAIAETAPDPEMKAATSAFDDLRLSAGLARYGRAKGDAWALAQAARLRARIPTEAIARTPEGGAPATAGDASAEAWLQEAESMARPDDATLTAFISDVRSTVPKGRSGGPRVSVLSISPGAIHRYGERFESDRPAVVYVEGDGDTDLSLTVFGPAGEAACADTAPGDVKLCAWRPLTAGRYRVEVRNRGRVDNRYAFATN